MQWLKGIALRVAIQLVIWLMDLLLWTLRVDVQGKTPEITALLKSKRYIHATWHGRMVVYFFIRFANRATAVMSSKSKDGTLAALFQQLGGYRVFRGSSKKGGQSALGEMIDYVKASGMPAMLSVDGPTGPIYQAKLGVLRLAEQTDYAIIPIAFSATGAKRFRSWDENILPRPFSKATLIYGKPIYVPKNTDTALNQGLRNQLTNQLRSITYEADKRHGMSIHPQLEKKHNNDDASL